MPSIFPTPASEAENRTIVVSDVAYRAGYSTYMANCITDLHLLAGVDAYQCFPFYTYAEDGTARRENITDWALGQFQAAYGAQVTKRDVFHYVYAMLHHPQYRERYAENLKRELPRIPLVGTAGTPKARAVFERFVAAGARLAELHVGYEQVAPYPLRQVTTNAAGFTWNVTKMQLSRDRDAVVVNEHLRLEGVPAVAFNYRLGNRSALEWVIDQFQVTTDKRSQITTDPNRVDDPQYIATLVPRVVTVSVETMAIIAGLPELG